MFQTISGVEVFVVDLTEIPPLPIHSEDIPELRPYAAALDSAIRNGIVKEPGKYGINITASNLHWNVFKIQE